jgi:hypothetical protein
MANSLNCALDAANVGSWTNTVLWKIVRTAVLALFASMIGLPILAVGSVWIFDQWVMRAAMTVVYGATFLFIAWYYLVLGGIKLSDRTARSRFRGPRHAPHD